MWMTPVLPFINDTQENIMGILQECEKAGVYGILTFGIGLTLRDGDRQYFYDKLDQHFPGMKDRYMRNYGEMYELPVPDQDGLMELVKQECERSGMEWREDKLFEYLHQFEDKQAGEQMTLFDLYK